MWLSCLEVLKQQEILNAIKEGAVVNFRGHKAKTRLKPMHFFDKNVQKKLWFTSLEAKKQVANNNWLSLRIKASKQCMCNLFDGLKCIK